MLLRSILELSSRRIVATRIPRPNTTTTQPIPRILRRELSTTLQQNGSRPQPNNKPESGGGSVPKVVIGGALVGAAVLAAYQTGYVDRVLGGGKDRGKDEPQRVVEESVEARDVKDSSQFEDRSVLPDRIEVNEAASSEEKIENIGVLPDHSQVSSQSEDRSVLPDRIVVNEAASSEEKIENIEVLPDHSQVEVQDKPEEVTPREENDVPTEENKDFAGHYQSLAVSDDQNLNSGILPEENRKLESSDKEESSDGPRLDKEAHTSPVFSQSDEAEKNDVVKEVPSLNIAIEKRDDEIALSKEVKEPSSLLDEYNLEDAEDRSSYSSLYNKHGAKERDLLAEEKEALSNTLEELGDAYITEDGKLVLDFLQAIHAAESRQAELDARMYLAEKKALKEKYDLELKDAAIRELMLAEEVAMLDKELKRERVKAAAALKSLQEQLEEKYKNELENKKHVAENKLKRTEELAKAELAAKIASEKAAQLEKIAEANLHINALCMAFYARSEEARRSHSAHKLTLGALALEDALSRGLPIQAEIGALRNYLEGIDKDSVLDLVLSSLPDETRINGTDTILQLNHKFDSLKGTLRHFSLIPNGGGGLLAHSVARVASWLKVKETDHSGDGIESLINRVESHLADGNISEAADVLEEGLQGTEASKIAGDWVRRARNRAITEQALTLLQSYATSISVT